MAWLFFYWKRMEYVAQFLKNAFFLMFIARIAVIIVLVYFISRLFYTPTLAEMIRRFRGTSRRGISNNPNKFQKVS